MELGLKEESQCSSIAPETGPEFIGKNETEMRTTKQTTVIEFSDDDLELILKYQEISNATSIKNAIMNAISIVLDHCDD